ncbi:MAG: hypothetical protein GXY05_01850 [Clostridiales bacterium]|nr:hypothetical protein [Clostridiales bacterium]
MCGIAGWIDYSRDISNEKQIFEDMTKTLVRRGPDDEGYVEYVWNVPWKFKNYNGREKGLLRLALEGLLPENVLWRKKALIRKPITPITSRRCAS